MPLRKSFFWIHLAAGVTAGLVILAMSVTGVLLAFERQIVGWAERDLRATASESAGQALPVSAIVNAAMAASPDAKPSNVILRADPRAPVTVAFSRERTLFVNRYSGVVLGEGAKGVRHFFQVNEDVHRWLALKGEIRDVGKKLTGIANAIFLFIVLSGLYIWIPKRKTRAAFGNAALFRGGLRGRARDFNWHNVLGVWSFLPLVLIVFSGMVISFPWASAMVYRAFGDEPPKPQNNERERGNRGSRGGDRGAERAAENTQLDRLWSAAIANAANVAPHWQSISGRLPLSPKGPVTFALDEGNGGRPDKRSQLLLDPRSGSVVEHKTYTKQSSGQKARAWLRFIHTGEAGGIAGQIVAALATAAAAVLVWTGIALALRRLRRWLRGLPEMQPNNNNSEMIEGI
jgi:uncharacterized iron-regulated membrane protein